MRVIYLIYSITGWFALALLLAFWAGVLYARRHEQGARGFDVLPPSPPPSPSNDQQHQQ